MAIETTIKKVLLVDDDPDDCSIFTEELKAIDPAVKLVCLSEASHLLLHALQVLPDLIFLDIDMPRVDGFACLLDLRKDNPLQHVPVVMYSSSHHPRDVEKAYQSGANLFVRKPSKLSDINAMLAVLQLDWKEPEKITAAFVADGTYKPFGVAE